ncbi:MAG: hypothetical protein L6Q78_14355 [Bacteroidia bacterium]|nr:hypothetical protein [Bacteroidia bacterium]
MLRWTARIATLVGIFFLLGFFTSDQIESMDFKGWIVFAFFPVAVLSGYILSWIYDRTGAALSLGGILLYYLAHWLLGMGIPLGSAYLLFAVPPLLFVLARRFSAKPA